MVVKLPDDTQRARVEVDVIPPTGKKTIDYRDPLFNELRYFDPVMNLVRHSRLRAELLEGVNPEINSDARLLVSRAEALGFPGHIEVVLDLVDQKLGSGVTPFDFKECMGHVRTVMDEVFRHAATRASKLSSRPLPDKAQAGEFHETKNYLFSVGVITDREEAALRELYNYISVEGAHAFGSQPEQARVAKNNVVEWCMLVVGRIQNMVAAKPTSAPAE